MNRTLRSIVIIFSLVFVGGCAAFGPSVDDPRLQSEFKAAREALEEARQRKAPKYRPEQYTAAEDRFNNVRTRHKNDPSESIIADYRLVQVQANRATIDSLVDQINEKEQTISQRKQENKQLRTKVQNQRETLDDRESELSQLENKNQQLRSTVESLRGDVSTLRDTVAKREQTIEDQEEQIKTLSRENERLQSRLDERRSELKEANNARESALATMEQLRDTVARIRSKLSEKQDALTSLREENKKIAEQVREKLEEGSVRQEDDKVVVNLQERILFDLGEARLKPEARETLKKVASVIKDYENRRVVVNGHTDDLPIKETIKDKFPSNWELSAQRAINVVKYMIHGLQLPADRLSAVAYGKTKPLVPNNSTANRAKNRRVEVVLLPESVTLSPTDAGETDSSNQ